MAAEIKGLTDDEAKACLGEPDDNTKGFLLQQTMYRIKDPKASLKFYTEVIGMRLLFKFDMAPMKFTAYFMGFEDAADIPNSYDETMKWVWGRKGTIELVHNWGSEDDPSVSYHNGNSEPGKGFGHIGVSVPDLHKACEYFEKKGVKFIKKPDGGKMRGIAFIQDPDGYWIEILSPNSKAELL